MSDNLTLLQGSGATLASDDVDGIQVLRVKLQTGADGTANDVTDQTPLPVSLGTVLPAGNNHLGSVDVDALAGPLPAGTNGIGTVGVHRVAGGRDFAGPR
jgi:hypothetical protein